MSTEDQARRGSSWEAVMRTLAADAVVAEAVLYASGGRRLTVEHGQPLTQQAAALVQQLVDDVDAAAGAAGCLGGTVTSRPTSITWTFPSSDAPARQVVAAALVAADKLNPGGWIITAADFPQETPEHWSVGPTVTWRGRDDDPVQGRSEDQRELLDAESVAGHLLQRGSVFAFLAEHRRRLFPDEMFADLFPSNRGRPSVPAEVMASVIVLQTLHGLSDSETTDALTYDLR